MGAPLDKPAHSLKPVKAPAVTKKVGVPDFVEVDVTRGDDATGEMAFIGLHQIELGREHNLAVEPDRQVKVGVPAL